MKELKINNMLERMKDELFDIAHEMVSEHTNDIYKALVEIYEDIEEAEEIYHQIHGKLLGRLLRAHN